MTKTIPSDIRKQAKRLARQGGISHQSALDQIARGQGHADWSAVLKAAAGRRPDTPIQDLMRRAWNAYVNDIHIEPSEDGARILFRIHGRRIVIDEIDAKQYDALERDIEPLIEFHAESRLGDGSGTFTIDGDKLEVRIAATPDRYDRNRIVIRLPERYTTDLSLAELGIEDLEGWMGLCRSGPGLIIVSGSTNSGKATTMAKTVDALRQEGINALSFTAPTMMDRERMDAIVVQARTRTVLLKAHGKSMDRAMANLLSIGLSNKALATVFLGGMHQTLERMPTGPRRLDAGILVWNRSEAY